MRRPRRDRRVVELPRSDAHTSTSRKHLHRRTYPAIERAREAPWRYPIVGDLLVAEVDQEPPG